MADVVDFDDYTEPEYIESDLHGDPAHIDEAVALLEPADDDARRDMRVLLISVAASYLDLREYDASAPRAKDARTWLERVEDLAGRLRRELDNPPSATVAQTLHMGPPDNPSAAGHIFDPDLDLSNRLEALSTAATSACGAYPDQGGSGNAMPWRAQWGHPKAKFVARAAVAYRGWRNDGTGTATGRFARVVAALYEAATGESADARGVGLERYVKAAGKLLSRLRAYDDEIDDLYARLGVVRNLGWNALPEGETRTTAEIQDRMNDAIMERARLYTDLQPIFDIG